MSGLKPPRRNGVVSIKLEPYHFAGGGSSLPPILVSQIFLGSCLASLMIKLFNLWWRIISWKPFLIESLNTDARRGSQHCARVVRLEHWSASMERALVLHTT